MRIGIDARFFGSVGKGLGRYTQKLIENLEKLSAQGGPASGGENEYFIFLARENFDEYQPQSPHFHKVLADCRWYSFAEQWKMPRLLRKYQLDLVHFPHFNVPLCYFRPFVITIHDLILLHFPTVRSSTRNRFFYWFKFWAYRLVIFAAIHRARRIITVSEFTRNDILAHYRVLKEKITVAYEAAEDLRGAELMREEGVAKILTKYGIIRPYILYVGNAYPHKNLDRLVSAFQRVLANQPDLSLVLVGREDYFYRRLKKKIAAERYRRIVCAGFMPDRDLVEAYRAAEAFVFPSLYEGFGLPPLEAMTQGVPVASSDHAAMREILSDAALYFDAQDEARIAQAMERIIADQALRNQLTKKGAEQVARYSWNAMAEATLAAYNQS